MALKTQLVQVPENSLRTHLISGISVKVERGADVGISDQRVLDVWSCYGGFYVIEDEVRSRTGCVTGCVQSDSNGMKAGSYALFDQTASHQF